MTITLDSLSFVVLILVPALLGFAVGWIGGKAEGRDNARAAAPAAWAWEHFNTATGEVVGTGLSATRVEPTMHAYYADEAGTQWIGTRVKPLRP